MRSPHSTRDSGFDHTSAGGPNSTRPNSVGIGIVLHELATNAAKYATRSMPQGVVELKWNLSSVDKKEVLLRWVERDGPEVAEPTRRGFGPRFIEQGIAYELGGEVTLQFDPAGLQCDMRIPI